MDSSHKRDIEGMGVPEIKYGDSVCFVQHVASGLWVTYKAQDAKTSRLGPLKRKVGVRKAVQNYFTLNWKQRGKKSDYDNQANVVFTSYCFCCSEELSCDRLYCLIGYFDPIFSAKQKLNTWQICEEGIEFVQCTLKPELNNSWWYAIWGLFTPLLSPFKWIIELLCDFCNIETK